MFNEWQNLNLFTTSATDIVFNIAVALACGLFIAWLYRVTYRGPGYSQGFLSTIILLSMVTAVVIMVIGNNLARAFGLVGAMSIIRFRTAIKDPLDIIYVFFSLAMGMAAGVGYYKIAVTGTVFIGFVLFIISRTNIGLLNQKEYLLQFSYIASGDKVPDYNKVINQYCRKSNVINVKTSHYPNLLEVSYHILFKDKNQNHAFVQELKNVQGVQNINLFFDEEEF